MKNCYYRKSDSAVQNEYVKKTLCWVEKLDFQDRRIKLSAVGRWPYLRFGRSVNTSGASNRAEPELRKPEMTKINASASVNINIKLVYQYSSSLGKPLIRKRTYFTSDFCSAPFQLIKSLMHLLLIMFGAAFTALSWAFKAVKLKKKIGQKWNRKDKAPHSDCPGLSFTEPPCRLICRSHQSFLN